MWVATREETFLSRSISGQPRFFRFTIRAKVTTPQTLPKSAGIPSLSFSLCRNLLFVYLHQWLLLNTLPVRCYTLPPRKWRLFSGSGPLITFAYINRFQSNWANAIRWNMTSLRLTFIPGERGGGGNHKFSRVIREHLLYVTMLKANKEKVPRSAPFISFRCYRQRALPSEACTEWNWWLESTDIWMDVYIPTRRRKCYYKCIYIQYSTYTQIFGLQSNYGPWVKHRLRVRYVCIFISLHYCYSFLYTSRCAVISPAGWAVGTGSYACVMVFEKHRIPVWCWVFPKYWIDIDTRHCSILIYLSVVSQSFASSIRCSLMQSFPRTSFPSPLARISARVHTSPHYTFSECNKYPNSYSLITWMLRSVYTFFDTVSFALSCSKHFNVLQCSPTIPTIRGLSPLDYPLLQV